MNAGRPLDELDLFLLWLWARARQSALHRAYHHKRKGHR